MPKRLIRYAVVGCGHIAQVAVLPAFGNARRNSKLAAIVSGDPVKRAELAKKYDVPLALPYEAYDELLKGGQIDAVYIALPNSMHAEYFERANLEAVEIARSGRIGEPRLFTSTFTMTVVPGNIRVQRALGGGVLYDIGIYCINAARSLFRDEPTEVRAIAAGAIGDVEESVSALLRFPNERLASFSASFGAGKVSEYRLVGTKGELAVDPAYEYARPLEHRLALEGNVVSERRFAKRDQFAPELLYFSDCLLTNRDPEPSAEEGLADVRVIRALYRSIATGQPVQLPPYERRERPSLEQEIRRPP